MDRQATTSFGLSARISVLFLLFTTSLGCSQHIGRTIDAPVIPVAAATKGPSSGDGSVMVGLFKDLRQADDSIDGGERSGTTQPQGAVGEKVADALSASLQARGINIAEGAPVRIWGEIRRWESSVTTTTTGVIRSEAAIYLEVLGVDGRPRYSGTYHGSRTSQFPFISARDVQDSLGIAMAQAIEQAVNDEELLRALW